MIFANIFSIIILLAAFAVAQIKDDDKSHDENWPASSQTIFKFVNVPVKSYKYISPLRPDYQLRPLLKSKHPIRFPKPKKTKPMFTPDPKYIGYTSFRLANMLSKNSFNKFPELYKPIYPNFNLDLSVLNLPPSFKGKQKFEYEGIRNPDPFYFKNDFKQPKVPDFYELQHDFLESASPKQIEQYLEDQQKIQDEKIELQLLNDPSPAAKGKYQQFLKAKEDEKIEKEYIEELKKHEKHRSNNYAPVLHEEPKPIMKAETPGLRHYRTKDTDESAYEFELTLPE